LFSKGKFIFVIPARPPWACLKTHSGNPLTSVCEYLLIHNDYWRLTPRGSEESEYVANAARHSSENAPNTAAAAATAAAVSSHRFDSLLQSSRDYNMSHRALHLFPRYHRVLASHPLRYPSLACPLFRSWTRHDLFPPSDLIRFYRSVAADRECFPMRAYPMNSLF
jgi:hypothetical protein